MNRVLLRVAYDGTDFHGWQLQPGVRTVEGELNKALSELTKEEITVIGASRTDAGVHAKGNVAVFDTNSTIPPRRFSFAVNTLLPEDVKVMESVEVPGDFHPRKTDCRKTYSYRIYCSQMPDPMKRRDSWHFPVDLDLASMREAAKYLLGTHDFASFCSVHTQAESTVRTIYSLEIREFEAEEGKEAALNETAVGKEATVREAADGKETTESGENSTDTITGNEKNLKKEIVILVTGNGFLYNMIRIIVGSLAEVGRGNKSPEWMKEALEGCDRTLAGPTAPPQGLVLEKIGFLPDI